MLALPLIWCFLGKIVNAFVPQFLQLWSSTVGSMYFRGLGELNESDYGKHLEQWMAQNSALFMLPDQFKYNLVI